MMLFMLRNACREDIPAVYRIEKDSFSLPMTAEQIASLLPDRNHIMIVAVRDESDHDILGYAEVTIVLDEGYVSNIAVRKDCRRNGIAAAMLERVIAESEKKGLSFITLEVRESNSAAIALYSKLYFEKAGLLKNHFTLPKENALIMTRYFKNFENGGAH